MKYVKLTHKTLTSCIIFAMCPSLSDTSRLVDFLDQSLTLPICPSLSDISRLVDFYFRDVDDKLVHIALVGPMVYYFTIWATGRLSRPVANFDDMSEFIGHI